MTATDDSVVDPELADLPPVVSEAPESLVDRVVEALAVISLVMITLLLLGNALGRYLISKPLPWAEEVATSLVVWLTMFGMFITARRREMIRITAFVRKLNPRTQDLLRLISDVIVVIALAYLTWIGVSYLATFGGDKTPFLRMPKGLFTSAIPVGAAILGIVSLVDIVGRLRKGRT